MRLFDPPQARHFCSPAEIVSGRVGRQSLHDFYSSLSKGVTLMDEGGKNYEIHQVNVLDFVERWLVYSVVHYRKSLEMLAPASAPWAHVTLYYSSFFAANAILGMFGGWIAQLRTGPRLVDVEQKVEGAQVLRVHRKLTSPNLLKGSHKVFWDLFYSGAAQIAPWVPSSLSGALEPVNGDVAWQTSERNGVNYDMFVAWNASVQFHQTFRAAKLSSLTGPLRQQFETTEKLVKLGLYFAADFGVSNKALDGVGKPGTRLQIRRRLIKQSVPNLVGQSELAALLDA